MFKISKIKIVFRNVKIFWQTYGTQQTAFERYWTFLLVLPGFINQFRAQQNSADCEKLMQSSVIVLLERENT